LKFYTEKEDWQSEFLQFGVYLAVNFLMTQVNLPILIEVLPHQQRTLTKLRTGQTQTSHTKTKNFTQSKWRILGVVV